MNTRAFLVGMSIILIVCTFFSSTSAETVIPDIRNMEDCFIREGFRIH